MTEARTGRERRRFPRVPFDASVVVIAAGEVESLRARDLSAGGIFVYSPRPPAVGSQVCVEFATDRERRFAVTGTVVRATAGSGGRPGFAVDFQVSPDVQQEIVRALLAGA